MISTRILIAVLVLLLSGCNPAPPPDEATQQSSAPAAGTAPPDDAAEEPCKLPPPPEPVMCTADWNPVCGCDGVTYSNACNAGAAGVTRFEPGECDKKDRL